MIHKIGRHTVIELLTFIALALGAIVAFGNEQQAPKKTNLAVLDFTADWCGPCQRMKPEWKSQLVQEALVGVEFYEINVDRTPEYVRLYRVGPIPTVIIVEVVDGRGKELNRFVGQRSAWQIAAFINNVKNRM